MALIEHLPLTPSLSGSASKIERLISLWRSRRALAALDSAALRDIGITDRAAKEEAERPIWDVPCNWRHKTR